ncbi:hypothetical protein BS50DRAFT_235699 [Corynespora cassiicola Philippines]|uniref:Uncharacterized protein n=1 Tax=Corynespora cassiicola Philippines TaxID=1448308 RepID=A0A2T2P2C4_CORCC|nr:hypothetical protein BS50DRAFT_235699 [Corynespora cassiicola Philippines]
MMRGHRDPPIMSALDLGRREAEVWQLVFGDAAKSKSACDRSTMRHPAWFHLDSGLPLALFASLAGTTSSILQEK